jgi:hypothetical protein
MRNEFLLKEERMRKTGKKKQNAPTPPPPPPQDCEGWSRRRGIFLGTDDAGSRNEWYVCMYICMYVCM